MVAMLVDVCIEDVCTVCVVCCVDINHTVWARDLDGVDRDVVGADPSFFLLAAPYHIKVTEYIY